MSVPRISAVDGTPPALVSPDPHATAAAPRDRAAFEASVRPLYEPLLRRLTLVLGDRDDAEDAAQEAYLRAFRAWPRADAADVRAWLYTIGLRVAFDTLRRRRRWIDRIVPSSRSAPASSVSYEDRVDPDLWAALAALDPRHRAALLANVLDGYTQREIARMLGVPEGTVASWLSRARATLRGSLSR